VTLDVPTGSTRVLGIIGDPIAQARSPRLRKRQAAEKRRNGPSTSCRSMASPGRFSFSVVNDWRRPRTPTVSVARLPPSTTSALASRHQGRKDG